jgi:N4-gp56 family major capsid protein
MSGITTRTPVMDSGSFLSTKIQAVYDRRLLKRAVDTQVWDRFGQTRTIPTNSNAKTAFAYRYKNILPATTPIAEYNGTNIKRPNKIVREEVEYGIAHYGDYIVYTDELDLYDLDNITSSFLDILGDQASLTVDTIRRDALLGGTNVVYADGSTSRAEVAANNAKLTTQDFKIMAVKLKHQRGMKFKSVITGTTSIGTQPIRSAYIGVVPQEVTEDLRDLVGWKNVETYSDYSKAMEDEVGSIGDFRIIETTNHEPVDEGGTNIYQCIFLAKDAYATVTLRGKGGISTKVKALGSAGTEDPLDQYGTIGWKAITGCAIINQAWIIRAETTVSIEDSSEKHYYDYTPLP